MYSGFFIFVEGASKKKHPNQARGEWECYLFICLAHCCSYKEESEHNWNMGFSEEIATVNEFSKK